jgi:hypothetical protein
MARKRHKHRRRRVGNISISGHRKHRRKRRMSGVTISGHRRRRRMSGVTIGSHRRRRHRKRGLFGMGSLGQGITQYLGKILLTATGIVFGHMIRNNTKFGMPRWWANQSSPADLLIIGGLGAGGMLITRRERSTLESVIFYISLGMTAYATSQLAEDFVPGIRGLTDYDISGLYDKINMQERQQEIHGPADQGKTLIGVPGGMWNETAGRGSSVAL